MLLNSDQVKFKRQGISKQFQFGFVKDIPLISSRKLAIGLGLGYSFQDYNLISLDLMLTMEIQFL